MANPPAPPPPPAMIPVTDPVTGKVGYLDPRFAPEASGTGLRAATATELKRAQIQANQAATQADLDKDYSGVVNGVALPVLAGAARGLTLGGSDVALAKLGGDSMRRRLLDYQQVAPISSAVGELGAIAGASLLGDEGGLADLPGLVGKLGRGAGAATEEALGGGLLARGAGAVVGGGAEGAIYGAAKADADAALHDEDATAERLLAGAGHGAIGGAALGAAFHGAGEVAGGVLGRFRGAGDDAGASLATRAANEGKPSTLGDMLQKGADVKTIKALGGSAGDLRKIEDTVSGGYQRVAQDVRADIESSTGKSIGFHNRESLHEYASKRVEELGDQLGGMLKRLDEAGGDAPNAQRFVEQARKDILDKLTVEVGPSMKDVEAWHAGKGPLVESKRIPAPGAKPVVDAVEGYLKQISEATDGRAPTFQEWQGWRKNLDKEIYEGARTASPKVDALRQVRALMEKELETSGEAAAQKMGSSFVDQYQATKSLYQSVVKAEELTARGVSRELANNSVGLNAVIGAGAGLAAGGPIGGLAMGALGKIIKDRGDQMGADLLSRAADIAGVAKLAARTDARIAGGVAKLVGAKPVGALETATPKPGTGFFSSLLKNAGNATKSTAIAGTSRAAYDKRVGALNALQANPAALSAAVAQQLGPIGDSSPKVAGAATTKAAAGLSFLTSKLPPSRQDPYTLQPQFQSVSRASDSEIAKHARYLEALDNPTIVLTEASKGTLTRDHVDAVKAVYPKLYAQMQETVMRSLVDSKSPLDYGKRIQLGILLDIPTDKTLSPDFMTAIQATYAPAGKAGAESPPPTLAAPLNIAGSLSTGTQTATAEGLEK